MGDYYKAKIAKAIRRLITNDGHLLIVSANERSITHRFALHLQAELPEWHIDCEYNRDGIDPKRLTLPSPINTNIEDVRAVTVFPDIIVHQRGTKNNLIVVELKTSSNITAEGVDFDKQKLLEYQKQLGHKHAYFVTIPVGNTFEEVTDNLLTLVERIGNDVERRIRKEAQEENEGE